MLKQNLQYTSYVLRHKWFVFRAGLRYRVPLHLLVIHDWSKFLRNEWVPYRDHFYGPRRDELFIAYREWLYGVYAALGFPAPDDELVYRGSAMFADSVVRERTAAFQRAWRRHCGRQPHHPQFWVSPTGYVFPMPERYVREMVADWTGAGQAQGKPDIVGWYRENGPSIHLHPRSRVLAEKLLDVHTAS